MPNEPITTAHTASKTVTDLSFHPQRRGVRMLAFVFFMHQHNRPGLLLASLRAEQRVEIFDVSLAPLSGSESAPMTPWRTYNVAEEVPSALFLRSFLRCVWWTDFHLLH
jgi:hypothetical protein